MFYVERDTPGLSVGPPMEKLGIGASEMAELFATETATWACERALHLCGAQGYMLESKVQRFYRDCKVLELGEGTSEIQRETIARELGV